MMNCARRLCGKPPSDSGWIEREIETFVARGFTPVSLGAPVLRVEAAVASALGQLALLHRLRGA
jgi:16S rRNA U1498 N3-methylase RsmE